MCWWVRPGPEAPIAFGLVAVTTAVAAMIATEVMLHSLNWGIWKFAPLLAEDWREPFYFVLEPVLGVVLKEKRR